MTGSPDASIAPLRSKNQVAGQPNRARAALIVDTGTGEAIGMLEDAEDSDGDPCAACDDDLTGWGRYFGRYGQWRDGKLGGESGSDSDDC